MKLFFICFCYSTLLAAAQTDTVVTKTVSVNYFSNVSSYSIIEGFPKKSFAITDYRFKITLDGKIAYKGTFTNGVWQRDINSPLVVFKGYKLKPGMLVYIDMIHVIRRPGATGEIEIPKAVEFILTE
jgi:hypothetical protein